MLKAIILYPKNVVMELVDMRHLYAYTAHTIQRKLDTAGDTALVKGNEHEKPNKGHAALKILAEHIAQQLEERGFCLVFEQDLERCWPSNGMSRAEREGKIRDFAQTQGWTAAILDAGFRTRAIFQKAEPGIDAEST